VPKLPEAVRNGIVGNYYDGLGRNDNFRKTRRTRRNLSSSSVTETIRGFYDSAERNGTDMTAREYNVKEKLDKLREVAVFGHDNKIRLDTMLEGARLAKLLADLGITNPADINAFALDVYNLARESGYSAQDLIRDSKELGALRAKFGEFPQLSERWTKIGTELPQKEEQLKVNRRSIEDSKRENESLLAQHNLDRAILNEYEKNRPILQRFGLDISRLESFINALNALKANNFDPQAIIKKFNSITNLDQELETKNSLLDETKKKLLEVRGELESNSPSLLEVKRLKEAHLSVAQIQKIRDAIISVSARHGIETSQAVQKFETEVLENYDASLGLEPHVTQLQTRKEELTKDIEDTESRGKKKFEDLQRRIGDLETSYSQQREEIKAYSQLRGLGIDGATILRWKNIIDEASLNPVVIESELKEFGNLDKSKERAREELGRLNTDVQAKKVAHIELETKMGRIAENIKSITSDGVNSIRQLSSEASRVIKSVAEEAKGSLSEVRTDSDEVSKTAIKDIENYSKKVRDSVKADQDALNDQTRKNLKRMEEVLEKTRPLTDTINKALEAGERIGKFEASLMPILQLKEGKEMQSDTKVLFAAVDILDTLSKWSKNKPWFSQELSGNLSKVVVAFDLELKKVS
jgi:predicted  nucleic acid-binding Zn-ribbon protein